MKESIKVVRPLRSGQITIPAEFRQKLEIDEHTLLQITLVGDELRIRPVQVAAKSTGSTWARELYELFAPVREQAAQYTEEEVNRDIDEAVAEVKKNRGQGSS